MQKIAGLYPDTKLERTGHDIVQFSHLLSFLVCVQSTLHRKTENLVSRSVYSCTVYVIY